MYAIIETGSKQYKVAKDDILDVELLDSTKEELSLIKLSLFRTATKLKSAPLISKAPTSR